PTYMDKTGRNGMRVGDLQAPEFEERYATLKAKHLDLLKIYPEIEFDLAAEEARWMECIQKLLGLPLVDGEYFINDALDRGESVLAEGAQGSMLDVDFGTYPFVTSSNTITAGVCTGLGVAPSRIGEVIGITKAYCTRVGSGPFPTELHDETGELLRKEGAEFGATTGRPRRCGWIDLVQLRYTILINGVTQLTITKVDILNNFETIRAAATYEVDGELTRELPYDLNREDNYRARYTDYPGWKTDLAGIRDYEKLPGRLRDYLSELERELGVPVTMVSTGPDREQLIIRT
ncbi:MAG: adenylosuccinate synthetase, partial [Saprospiraceae bacterium]